MKSLKVLGGSLLLLLIVSCSDDRERAADPAGPAVSRDYLALYYSPTTGVHAVDVADFTAGWNDAIAPGTRIVTQYAGDLTAGVILNWRPYALYYFENPHWYRRNLRTDADAASVQLTDAPQPDLCEYPLSARILETDLADPQAAMLVYSTAGADNDCQAGLDNDTRMVPVGGAPNAPTFLPGPDDFATYFHGLYDSAGVLAGVLTYAYGATPQIVNYDPTFATRETLVEDFWGGGSGPALGSDYIFMQLNDSLYRLSDAGAAIVHTATPGSADYFAWSPDADDGALGFFVERDTLPATHSRLWRITLADAQPAELVHESDSAMTIVGLTGTQVVFKDAGGMMAIPKLAHSDDAAAQLDDAVTQAWTVGASVFYNKTEIVDGHIERRALLRRDTGELVFDLARSEWAGYSLRAERGLDSYLRRDIVFGLLAEAYSGKYDTTGQKGALLRVYDFTAATFNDIGVQGESGSVLAYGMRGPAGTGYFDHGNGELTDTDVVGLDFERALLVRITRMAGNEAPLGLAE